MNTLLKWLEWHIASKSTDKSKILAELIRRTKVPKFRKVLGSFEYYW